MRSQREGSTQSSSPVLLTLEELLIGSEGELEVEVPAAILHPSVGSETAPTHCRKKIRLRPLTVRDVQLIAKAAKTDEVLTSVLMIQQALVEPKLKQQEIARMHSGLVKFLMEQINRLSGLTTEQDELKAFAESPIAKAFFVLAKEFHWTPDEVKSLTIGQILGYLELLNQSKRLTAL
jgi:hypothetical protein